MRILLTTRGSAGHLLPLAPFGHACRRAGHAVMVAAQRQNRAHAERTGLPFAPFDDPPKHEWMPLMAEFAELDLETANDRMVGEFFARIDTTAALPGLRAIVEDWRPDVMIRESYEYASTLLAEQYAIPTVRVALSLAQIEERAIQLAAPAVDAARARLGLAPDPAGDRLRDTPCFTMVPEPLDDSVGASARRTYRFAQDAREAEATLTDWWPGNDDPLIYLSFGSIAGQAHLPFFPALYRAAIDALAPLRARILVTVGSVPDPVGLGPVPANVHVEKWVAHDAVARHAAVIVCHGGFGSTLGSLRHGVPLVVMPLFAFDQWANAAAVARAGAGIALTAERTTREVLGLPAADTIRQLAPAVARVLGDPAYGREARRIADATRALPPVDSAVALLTQLAREGIAA